VKEFMDLTPDESYDLCLQCASRERLVEECKTLRRMLMAEQKQVKALEERIEEMSEDAPARDE
jgi:hypothetical protein